MEHGTIGQTCASRDFSFWECVSCNFSACPSLLAARFSTSANNLSLSCCINRSVEKREHQFDKLKITTCDHIFIAFLLPSPLFSPLQVPKVSFQNVASAPWCPSLHKVSFQTELLLHRYICQITTCIKDRKMSNHRRLPSKRTAQPRALSHV